MGRQAVRFATRPRRKTATTSLLAVEGQNLRDLPQLLDSSQAQVIRNFNIDAQGQLVKRKGSSVITTINGKAQFFDLYFNDFFLVTYTDETSGNHTLSAIDIGAKTETVIKSDFSEFPPISGDRYGNYFFLGTGGTEKVGRVSTTLNYDAEVAAFTAGEILTGATSGATALILEVVDNGTTGVLTIGDISGTFQDGEQITDSATGDATVDGTLNFVYEEVTAAPVAKIVRVLETGSSLDARLFAGNFRDDISKLKASEVDNGANPPFDNWTLGTTPTSAFEINNKRIGELQSIVSLGSQVVVGGEFGRYGFRLTTIDIGGVASQDVVIDFNNKQEGMQFGAIETATGVYFGVKDSSIFRMISGGQTNVPFSEQTQNVGIKLGDDFFQSSEFNNLTVIEDTRRKLIYYSYDIDSETNNVVTAYNTDTNSLVQYDLNIQRFAKRNDRIFGASSTDGRILELFVGDSDDGKPIFVDYQQELQINSLGGLSDLDNFWIQAILSEDSEYRIEFNIYDRNGTLVTPARTLLMQGKSPTNQVKSWGSAGWTKSGWGSGAGGEAPKALPYQIDIKIPELWRLSVRVTGNDKLPASINWFIAALTDRQENLILNNLEFTNS